MLFVTTCAEGIADANAGSPRCTVEQLGLEPTLQCGMLMSQVT